MPDNTDEQILELCRGCDSVISQVELSAKLVLGKPLKVKAGFDPTAPDLHFGHLVLLNKLRTFQHYGHEVIFLIGDYTGLIGDPSGRNATRPQLGIEDIKRNAETYSEQVFKILDRDRTRIEFNSSWCNSLDAAALIGLMQKITVARIIERDDFSRRLREHHAIGMHELVYPLIQAYDSVALHADVELGGSDQLFNLLLGRQMQQHFDQPQQVAMVVPLLEGLDGVQKMSKSLNNYIAFNDSADDMYGKVMSVSDDLMWRYFELISSISSREIERMRSEVAAGANPMDCKFRLAGDMVGCLHGSQAAAAARENFQQRFQNKQLPDELPERVLRCERPEQFRLAVVLRDAGLVGSSSEALRQIRQNAVRVDEQRCTDAGTVLQAGRDYIVQVGKRRIAKVRLQAS